MTKRPAMDQAAITHAALELWNRRQGRSLPRLQARLTTPHQATTWRISGRGGTAPVRIGGYLCQIEGQRPARFNDTLGAPLVVVTIKLLKRYV